MKVMKLLLEAKADVNVQGKDGGTALRVAANMDTELVKQLLDAKMDVNIQDEDG